ncbi:MAG: ABC transporter permease [Syntrophomonadaceae bacterium]|nr:ABC transporter permease [Syntrophomonadaceae bacterium]
MKALVSKDQNHEMTLLFILIVLGIAFSIFSESFFKIGNMLAISAQMAELSLLTLGMSVCIISGGFDLSIGAMAGLSSVCLAVLISSGMDMGLTIILVLGLLLLCGLINGILIGYLRINSMLVTLGTSSVFMGIAIVISQGRAISGLTEEFAVFGQQYLGVIPVQTMILIVILAFSFLILSYSTWGRRIYLIGSNYEVARFAGINCGFNIMLVYVYSAAMAFLASLILTSRLATGRADLGETYVMQSVAAAVFGGIGINGGSGNLAGAILGVAVFVIISNGFNMLDFSQYAQQIVIGSILIVFLAYRAQRNQE